MMMMPLIFFTAATLFTSAFGTEAGLGANPVRKVVTLLQNMSKKVEAEGQREEELYEKYKCYCKTTDADVSKSVEEANEKLPQLEATIKESSSSKSQLQQELSDHKGDRAEGEASLAKAAKLREKEHAQFEKDSSDARTNIAAMGKAVKAIEANQAGSAFLQTADGRVWKNLLETSTSISDDDRAAIVSFFTTGNSSGGSSGEIVGILKTIQEETQKDLDEMVAEEEAREKGYVELTAGKRKEIASATSMIETKTERVGVLAVKVSEASDDFEEYAKTLASDQEFLVNLRKGCKAQDDAIAVRKETRSEELTAIADTIKILNDDDALDLFKKTLPSPEVALIQMHATTKSVQKRALYLMNRLPQTTPLSLIEFSLKSKKVDFSKVTQLIDNLVVVLKKEQVDDDKHKAYCEKEFDASDDKKKATERNVSSAESQKAETEGAIEALIAEINALKEGITSLDKNVAVASTQRKAEHAEFSQTAAENQASLGLIEFAKNRMQKFYNPKLYKAPPPQEMSEEDRIFTASGGELAPTPAPGGIAGTGITVFQAQQQGRPAPPPAPVSGDYKKGESGGVIGLMDNLANDLKKEMQEAEFEEKDAQEEYEKLTEDAKKKRASDSEAVTSKETAKANADETLQNTVESLEGARAELIAVKEAIANLHGTCDFLVQNYDTRKQARAQEIEGLTSSRSVLAGSNYSLTQQEDAHNHQTGFLQK